MSCAKLLSLLHEAAVIMILKPDNNNGKKKYILILFTNLDIKPLKVPKSNGTLQNYIV